MRTAGVLAALGLLLPAVGLAPAEAEPQRSRPAEGELTAARLIYPPFYCGTIDTLAVDFVNDADPVPRAFSIPSGTLEKTSGLALFGVYGRSREAAFANVTWEFRRPNRRPGTVTARPAPGSRKVPGRIYYTEFNGQPVVVFRPQRRYRDDRTVILTFRYYCYERAYEEEFELLVKGTGK